VGPGGFLAWFDTRVTAIRYELSQGAYAQARRRLEDLHVALAAGVESDLIRTRMQAVACEVAYHLGETEDARSGFESALGSFDRMNFRPEAWQVTRYLGWCADRLAAPGADRERLARESDRRLEELAATLSPEEKRVYLLNKWTVEERRLAADRPRVEQARNEASVARWVWPWSRFRFWREAHRFLETVQRYHEDRADRLFEKVNGEGRRRGRAAWFFWLLRHPRDRVTLSFLVFPDSVFVLRAGWFDLSCQTAPLTRVGVRNLVSAWHEAATARKEREASRVAAELSAELRLDDLLKNLPARVTRMTVAADDSLHGFPFAALPIDGKPLIDRFALTMALEHLPSPQPTSPRLRSAPVLPVGVSRGTSGPLPLPGTDLSVWLRELPGVAREMRYLREWLGPKSAQVIVMEQEEATKSAVRDALNRAGLFHAACHGVFVPDNPAASGLALLPDVPDPASGAPTMTLQTLTLAELSQQRLPNLQHATLSSCWGADSYALPGRWIVSLPEVLLRAGARSVLSNLWRVDDATVVSFVKAFYDRLAEHPRDRAVQLAQRRLRSDNPSPLEWAGYQLYGSYDVLNF
jgi:CHAT domain-containing protein